MRRKAGVNVLLIISVLILGCKNEGSAPRPKGYPRISFPDREYQVYTSECPFEFEYLKYARVSPSKTAPNTCWLNLDYPFLKSRIHLSYKPVENNLGQYLEDSRTLVYKHTIKADAINEVNYIDTVNHVYAKVYQLAGDAASSVQFYATDSNNHFLRGALYFNAKTNADSLEPAIRFISEDIEYFISSLRWKQTR